MIFTSCPCSFSEMASEIKSRYGFFVMQFRQDCMVPGCWNAQTEPELLFLVSHIYINYPATTFRKQT